ncbi:hypothetical protein VTO42DRAFT_9050 [Malbranchea cinnamomea]
MALASGSYSSSLTIRMFKTHGLRCFAGKLTRKQTTLNRLIQSRFSLGGERWCASGGLKFSLALENMDCRGFRTVDRQHVCIFSTAIRMFRIPSCTVCHSVSCTSNKRPMTIHCGSMLLVLAVISQHLLRTPQPLRCSPEVSISASNAYNIHLHSSHSYHCTFNS